MANATAKKSLFKESPHHRKSLTSIDFIAVFHDVDEKIKYGQSVESPTYSSNGSLWRVKLYPKGKSARNIGCVSVYLTSSVAFPSAKCQFQFTFLNQSDHISFRGTMSSDCIEKDTQIGTTKLITSSELFDRG